MVKKKPAAPQKRRAPHMEDVPAGTPRAVVDLYERILEPAKPAPRKRTKKTSAETVRTHASPGLGEANGTSVSVKRPNDSPAPPTSSLFVHADHGVDLATAPRHAVARCRWCKKGFVRIYEYFWICESAECATRQVACQLPAQTIIPGQAPWYYLPLPMQVDIEENRTKHLLVAGAAGTAKSFGTRHLLYRYCQMIGGLRVLLLRETYDQLEKNHLQFMEAESRMIGASWTGGNVRQMKFPHEKYEQSVMRMGYCAHDADIGQHVGPEWDIVVIEEAVMVLPKAISEIIARARGSATAVRSKMALGLSPKWGRSICVSNPGGRSMMFLVDHFIRKSPDRDRFKNYKPEKFGHLPSTLDDNPYLEPDYEEENLSHLENSRYRQLRYGDWTAIAGQFFNFTDQHLVG